MALSARMFGRVPDESEADTPALEAKVSALEAKVSAGDMEPSTLLNHFMTFLGAPLFSEESIEDEERRYG